ncbi:TPA: Holliday junction DNA helicase RuvA [bacterium]|nr:Holliday junction DNA helicase RuvA [bacterium]
MISYLVGQLVSGEENRLILEVNGVGYEVFVPTIVMKSLLQRGCNEAKLYTLHYLEVSQNRSQPILIGFNNEVEREFFKLLIKVSGVGPRTACQALSFPFSIIAKAIDDNDLDLLCSLPGVGPKTARKIIAELQGKVGCFHLIQDEYLKEAPSLKKSIEEEGVKVLLQLQYKKSEAKEMIKKAFLHSSTINSVEELMNEIYRQRVVPQSQDGTDCSKVGEGI